MAEGEAQEQSALEKSIAELRAQIQESQARNEQLVTGLAQGISYVAEKTGVLEQAERERRAVPPALPPDANERLRKELWENPVGVQAQAIQIAKQQALAEAKQMIDQERQAAENDRRWGQFWDWFYQSNPDIDPMYHATVVDMFSQAPGTDPGQKAQQAAAWIRERQASYLANAVEQERRKSSDAGAVSTGNPARDFMGVLNPEGQNFSSDQHTQDYVARRRAKLELISGRSKAA